MKNAFQNERSMLLRRKRSPRVKQSIVTTPLCLALAPTNGNRFALLLYRLGGRETPSKRITHSASMVCSRRPLIRRLDGDGRLVSFQAVPFRLER